MKIIVVFLTIVVIIFGALFFFVQEENEEKLANNPYSEEAVLSQSTINQIDDPLYQNQISPNDLQNKLDQQKDLVVYFYSPECLHCQEVTPIIVPMTEKLEIDMMKVNILAYKEAIREFNITGTPTIVYYENGEEFNRVVGSQNKKTFKDFFNKLVID